MARIRKKIVLLVEDDEVLLRALYLLLHNSGFTIASSTDGESALKMAERLLPDLILLDLLLPKMNGFDVLKNLKSNSKLKDIPVIVLSNLGDQTDIERAKNLGALDYYVKANTELSSLEEKIKNVLV